VTELLVELLVVAILFRIREAPSISTAVEHRFTQSFRQVLG